MGMPRKTSTAAKQAGRPGMDRRHDLDLGERQRMIREAAYYRFIRRGYVHGHDLEDWLAAEAELFSAPPEPQATEAVEREDFAMQQHSAYSSMKDEALKRIIKKHPQRGIPQIEGIEPQEAPLKE